MNGSPEEWLRRVDEILMSYVGEAGHENDRIEVLERLCRERLALAKYTVNDDASDAGMRPSDFREMAGRIAQRDV